MAAGLMPMIAALGAAIDLARIYIVTTQMQAGVDAAALAGANAFDNENNSDPNGRYQQIVAYFRDNCADDYMGILAGGGPPPIAGTRTLLEPQFSRNNGISRTVVSASGVLPMSFLSIFGVEPRTIEVTAHAEYQPHPLEVMVVLDNTGSMDGRINGIKKIDALKTAMRGFINVLYQGSSNAQPNLAMGIINYTNQVNVGSLLKSANIPIETMPGFTDRDWSARDAMGWKGCVANDETVNTMSSSPAVLEPGAYDITNVLPGELPQPNSPHVMKPIRPLIMPPLWTGGGDTNQANSNSDYYTPSGDTNLYWDPAAGTGTTAVATMANSATFKRFFYRHYIGLNDGVGNMANDVIVAADRSSYYNPAAAGAFNPLTNTGTDFHVRAELIPNLSSFRAARHYAVTSNYTDLPSPNWQCPEPGLPIKYDVSRATFDDFINRKVWAVLPANGTMHHTGFIWGWRILSRYTTFTRTKPTGSGAPRRALVFMTDGRTELAGKGIHNNKVYTGYGSLRDKTITTGDNEGHVREAADLRFSKACALANSYVFPDSRKSAQIYVVGINASNAIDSDSQSRLRNCGKSGYWLSTTPTDLNNAFAQIARTLVDVHLTQ